mmetsp:Transcript_27068/g.42954  ORF Transcript_27068/g.42954 Transcript_27068/m.42954 type:complete len:204 (-) Transcript_27068:1198-1809(-)
MEDLCSGCILEFSPFLPLRSHISVALSCMQLGFQSQHPKWRYRLEDRGEICAYDIFCLIISLLNLSSSCKPTALRGIRVFVRPHTYPCVSLAFVGYICGNWDHSVLQRGRICGFTPNLRLRRHFCSFFGNKCEKGLEYWRRTAVQRILMRSRNNSSPHGHHHWICLATYNKLQGKSRGVRRFGVSDLFLCMPRILGLPAFEAF